MDMNKNEMQKCKKFVRAYDPADVALPRPGPFFRSVILLLQSLGAGQDKTEPAGKRCGTAIANNVYWKKLMRPGCRPPCNPA